MLSKVALLPEGALELERIFSSLNLENHVSRQLFRGKYVVSLQRNVLPWKIRRSAAPRSVGEEFETCLVVHGARPKRRLARGSSGSFGPVSSSSCEESLDASLFESSSADPRGPREDMNLKNYSIILMSQEEVQDLLKLCTWLGDRKLPRYPTAVFGKHETGTPLVRGRHLTEAGKRSRFNVVNPGTVLEQRNVPKFKSEMESHLVGFPRNTPVAVDAFAQFKIPFIKGRSKLPPCKFMDVDVECFWDRVEKTFEPPSVNGTFFVILRCIDGDDKTGAFERFKELKIVTALSESLESGLMTWSPSSEESLLARLEALLVDEKNSLLSKNTVPRDETTYVAFGNAVVSQRRNLDFVEKLWLVLKDSSSSEELVDAFTYVYRKLKEFIKAPYVHSDSRARIASDIKSINQGSIRVPSLDVRGAIEMLLEMAVEKLRRDYATLFHNFDLASVDHMKCFRLPESTSPKSVTLLKMLHVTVELSYICFEALQFPQDQLKEFVRSALEYFRTVETVDSKHKFCRQVPAEVALSILNTELLPTTWEMSLSSSDTEYRKQTVVRLRKIPRPKRFSKRSEASKTFKDAAYIFYRSTLVEDVI